MTMARVRPIQLTGVAIPFVLLLLLAAACGAAATPSPGPTGGPTETPTAPATPVATLVATPSPTAEPTLTPQPGLTWERIADAPDLQVAGGGMTSVVAGAPGFVAVGRGYERDRSFAVAWASADGFTWTRVPDTPDFDGAGIDAVVAGGPGFIAVGGGCCPDRAVVWISPDGVRWSRVPHSPVLDEAIMKVVTAWDEGFLALGWEAYTEAAGTLLWGSPDGITWSRLSSAAFRDSIVDDVAAGGPGLVAVGYRCPPGGGVSFCARSPAIWLSADGVGWNDVPVVDSRAGEISAIASGPAGLLAFGNEFSEALGRSFATIRTSQDGVAWTRLPAPAVFDGASVASVRSIGPAFFALGHRLAAGNPVPLIWRSTDGTDWEVVLEGSPNDAGYLWDVAGDRSVLVAVGQTEPEGRAMVWVSPAVP